MHNVYLILGIVVWEEKEVRENFQTTKMNHQINCRKGILSATLKKF